MVTAPFGYEFPRLPESCGLDERKGKQNPKTPRPPHVLKQFLTTAGILKRGTLISGCQGCRRYVEDPGISVLFLWGLLSLIQHLRG